MGIGLLTGEIGCGKTVTRTMLHRQLDRPAHIVVSLENCLLEFDDLLLEIISQMRGERISRTELPDRYSRLATFKQTLMRQVADSNRHLVILLDEAQQLSLATIESLKSLTNIASERQNFLTLILIGQPELRNTIRQLPQVDQRVSLRYHLNAMSHDETRATWSTACRWPACRDRCRSTRTPCACCSRPVAAYRAKSTASASWHWSMPAPTTLPCWMRPSSTA